MSSKIPDAIAREIIDCRGFPTIEVIFGLTENFSEEPMFPPTGLQRNAKQ